MNKNDEIHIKVGELNKPNTRGAVYCEGPVTLEEFLVLSFGEENLNDTSRKLIKKILEVCGGDRNV